MAGIQYNNAALIDGNGKLLRTGSSNTGGYITENQLKTWVLKDAGYTVNLELDQSTYVITPKVYNKANELIAVGQAVDLPLETMVVNATYDSTNKQITLTLKNGTTVSFSVSDLISGLATQAMVTAVGQRVTTETERATAAEATKADKSTTYTKTEVDGLVAAATPSDYAQVKEKVDQNATDIVGIASDCADKFGQNPASETKGDDLLEAIEGFTVGLTDFVAQFEQAPTEESTANLVTAIEEHTIALGGAVKYLMEREAQ